MKITSLTVVLIIVSRGVGLLFPIVSQLEDYYPARGSAAEEALHPPICLVGRDLGHQRLKK